jgi:hypothetical protein
MWQVSWLAGLPELRWKTIMNTLINQKPGTEVPKIPPVSFGQPVRDTWLSTIVISLMMITLLALFSFPVRRIFANVEVNYNEGWNAYRAAWVAQGIKLYATPPGGGFATGTAYPPISFHLVSWLGTANTYTLAGRLVSLISLLATGLFVALLVRQGGGSPHTAIFSFFLYEIGIAILRADRIGMYDPQLLGEALSTAGLYFYVRNPKSTRFLFFSALLFCLAGFTKHNLIAFPAAVAVDLGGRSLPGLVLCCFLGVSSPPLRSRLTATIFSLNCWEAADAPTPSGSLGASSIIMRNDFSVCWLSE